ncbi:hypothetical protein HDE_04910 [Halotydeus destructor]|nr:hypothetical protein HDE_04910 [Halotydeus destructor]
MKLLYIAFLSCLFTASPCQARYDTFNDFNNAFDIDVADWPNREEDEIFIPNKDVRISTYEVVNQSVYRAGCQLKNWTFSSFLTTMSRGTDILVDGDTCTTNVLVYPEYNATGQVFFAGMDLPVRLNGIITVKFNITFRYDSVKNEISYIQDESEFENMNGIIVHLSELKELSPTINVALKNILQQDANLRLKSLLQSCQRLLFLSYGQVFR